MSKQMQELHEGEAFQTTDRCENPVPVRGQAWRAGLLWMFAVVLLFGWAGVACAGSEITTCGQVVRGFVFLSGDLDCTDLPGDAVVLEGGTLDLRGFALRGTGGCTVRCTRSCKVTSDPPGGVVEGGFAVCDGPAARRVSILGVTLQDAGVGAFTQSASLVIVDSTITNNRSDGAAAISLTRGRLRVENSTITNNGGFGAGANRAILVRDSVVSENGSFGSTGGNRHVIKNSQVINNGDSGVGAGARTRIVDSTISGNGGEGILLSIASERLRVFRSTIDGNGADGILTEGNPTLIRESTITNNAGSGVDHGSEQPLRLIDSTVNGNGLHGVRVGALRAAGSQLTGNGTDPICAVTMTCADVASFFLPRLKNTTCDTSYDTKSGFPGQSWGLCALD